jgi:hypothetical protein
MDFPGVIENRVQDIGTFENLRKDAAGPSRLRPVSGPEYEAAGALDIFRAGGCDRTPRDGGEYSYRSYADDMERSLECVGDIDRQFQRPFGMGRTVDSHEHGLEHAKRRDTPRMSISPLPANPIQNCVGERRDRRGWARRAELLHDRDGPGRI